MDGKEWGISHWKRIFSDLKQEQISVCEENIDRIIEETSFRVRSKKHPDREHCWNYPKNPPIPCHPEVKDMNCLFCACPHYDTTTERGKCRLNSRKEKYIKTYLTLCEEILDCSDCPAYHSPNSARNLLKRSIEQLRALSEAL